MRFNDNDLKELIFKADTGNQFGVYQFTSWDVKFDAPSDSIIPQLISLHEYLHGQLNNSTLYGTVLHIYAYLVKNMEYPQVFESILEKLVQSCRTTHESYATFLSFHIANRIGGIDLLLNAQELLADNPVYLNYYNIGRQLASGFQKGHLSYCAVTSALRACMQGKSVLNLLMQVALNQLTPMQNLRWFEFPDGRLSRLMELISAKFWEDTLIALKNSGNDLQKLELIIASEADPKLYELTLQPEFDATIDFIESFFYDAIRQEFIRVHYNTLDYDGHIEPTKLLLEKAFALIPRSKAKRALISANSAEKNADLLNVRSFDNEKLMITEKPIRAVLSKLIDIPEENWHLLSAGTEPDEHFYLISRLSYRLLEQYEFSREDQKFLSSQPFSPLVCLQRSAIEGERIVEVFLIESPHQLDEFTTIVSNSLPIVSSLSMVSLGIEDWYVDWHEIIWKKTQPTVLFDVSPFRHLEKWLAQDTFIVKYNTLNCQIGNDNFYKIFLCQPQTQLLNAIYLAPCSEMVRRAIFYYIENMLQKHDIFRCEQNFITENKNSWLLSVITGHLFREEHFFDFNAGFKLQS